jgi:uncharacterized protein YndB with AHSA1/START domain
MTDRDGELRRIGDRYELRFERRLAHSRERVWRAITEPPHLAAWFPTRIDGERRAGAPLRFVFEHDEGPALDGELLVWDPPAVLELRWDQELLRFELAPADDGGCVLTFVNTFAELGTAARDAAGWHVCLEHLAHELAGTTPPWDDGARWVEVHGRYAAAFGPAATAIGPPAGHDPRERASS